MDSFFTLTPDHVLDSVEAALDSRKNGNRATGFALALNSVENRVYEIGLDDGTSVVTKFYRPERWTAEQILEEHRFIQKLYDTEIPVVPALKLVNSDLSVLQSADQPTLALSKEGIFFAVFPKIKARLLDELNDEQVRQIGRLLARLHAIGESPSLGPSKRITLDVKTYGEKPLELLLASEHMDAHSRARYEPLVRRICDCIRPMFQNVKLHRTHGDCHPGNILWTPSGAPFFVDFDDMAIAPAAQDLWMVVRGRDENALKQREELIAGYDIFKEFDRSQLRLIEPLRALRLIHYSAWIANRWKDPSFPKMFPDFGSPGYWREEVQELEETLNLIEQNQ